MSEEREAYKFDPMFVCVEPEESESTGNPWGNAKPTPLADIRAFMEKARGCGHPMVLPVQESDREKALVLALDHALRIIECYESDIAGSDHISIGLPLDRPLAAYGFCQGEMYRTAREFIKAVARGEKKP